MNPLRKIWFYKQEIAKTYVPNIALLHGDAAAWKTITAGLIFPNATQEALTNFFAPAIEGTVQKKYPQHNPLVSSDDLASETLERIFPLGLNGGSKFMSPRAARELRAWMVEPEHIYSQRQVLELDVEQKKIVNTRTSGGYRRVKGPAGSGKTVVLAAKAAKLASEGKRVLVVNYNITLMNYVRDLIVRAGFPEKGILKNVHLYSFHAWCKWICHEYGYDNEYRELWGETDRNDDNQPVLNEDLAELVSKIVTDTNKRFGALTYDAVLVDEGQDFRLSWWKALTGTVSDGEEKERMLFADMTQDLYGTADAWTEKAMVGAGFSGPWSELKTAYRLPQALIPLVRNYGERFLSHRSKDLPESRQGDLLDKTVLRWLQVSPEALVSTAADAVKELPHITDPDEVAYVDAVLLCDRIKTGIQVVNALKAQKFQIANTFGSKKDGKGQMAKRGFYMSAEKIKATTFHSFKGWEARYIVVCIGEFIGDHDKAALYAALTRLKISEKEDGSYLTVVCSEPTLAEYGETWPHGRAFQGGTN